MLNKEAKWKEQGILSHNEALIMEWKERNKHRDSQFNSDGSQAKSQERSKSQSGKYYNYGKWSHFKKRLSIIKEEAK